MYIYLCARPLLVVKTKSASPMLIIRNSDAKHFAVRVRYKRRALLCIFLIKINANFLINQLSFYVLRNANRSRRMPISEPQRVQCGLIECKAKRIYIWPISVRQLLYYV